MTDDDGWSLGPTGVVQGVGPVVVELGRRRYELDRNVLVMGIVNRTPDSFFDKGAYFSLDDSLHRAEALVAAGADIIDVGGVKAGPGAEVSLEEELDRVVPAVEALGSRIDVAISVDTWRAEVAGACFGAGAVLGNDISGFADPRYLEVAASFGAAVVATHIRLAPRIPDPEPTYPDDDVVTAVEAFLLDRLSRAVRAGLSRAQVVIDAGLDLGKTPAQSLALLQASARLAALGQPLLLSASNKTFLGAHLGLEIDDRRNASLAAVALGVARGCRIVRVHDVEGSRRVVDAICAVLGHA